MGLLGITEIPTRYETTKPAPPIKSQAGGFNKPKRQTRSAIASVSRTLVPNLSPNQSGHSISADHDGQSTSAPPSASPSHHHRPWPKTPEVPARCYTRPSYRHLLGCGKLRPEPRYKKYKYTIW